MKLLKTLIVIILVAFMLPAYSLELKRPDIKSVKFSGNKRFKSSRLKKLMGTKSSNKFIKRLYYQDIFIRDLKIINDFYYQHGFLDLEMSDVIFKWNTDSSNIKIKIVINEGEPVYLDSIYIYGADQIPENELRELFLIKKGDILDFGLLSLSEDKIVDYYGNRGYLYANVSRSFKREDSLAKIEIHINEGELYCLGEVNILGNEKTARKHIIDRLKIRYGDVLTLSEINSFRDQLYRQGLYEYINIETTPTDQENVLDLNVSLLEKDPGELSFGGGYDSEERVRLSGQVGYINLNGHGAGIGVKSRLSFKTRSVEAIFDEPYFFGSKYFFETSVKWKFKQEKYFAHESERISLRWGRMLSRHFQLSWGYLFKRTVFLDVNTELAETVGAGVGRYSGVFLEGNYDTRDRKVFSRKGILFSPKVGVGETHILGNISFLKPESDLRAFIPFSKGIIYSFQFKTASIFRLEDKSIPLDEVFFMSGENSVRGYQKSSFGPSTPSGVPIGGQFYYLFRTELLFHMYKPFWFKSFIDYGGLYKNIFTSKLRGANAGGGFGIRLVFGIWIGRVEYAWLIESDRILPGTIMFNVGQTF